MSRIIVYHAEYGCDTGCCGHVIELDDREEWRFAHPELGESDREFAERMVAEAFGEEHVKDLDWSSSRVVGNC